MGVQQFQVSFLVLYQASRDFILGQEGKKMTGLIKFVLAGLLTVVPIGVQAACEASIPATTPTGDFTIHGDGTVTHNKTGLMWKVCSEEQNWSADSCSGSIGTYTWQAALQLPQNLNASGGYAGYTDWRLPNIKELLSIAELSCYNPAINTAVFPSTASNVYWSASPSASLVTYASGVDFDSSYDSGYSRVSTNRVRLVRGGQ